MNTQIPVSVQQLLLLQETKKDKLQEEARRKLTTNTPAILCLHCKKDSDGSAAKGAFPRQTTWPSLRVSRKPTPGFRI